MLRTRVLVLLPLLLTAGCKKDIETAEPSPPLGMILQQDGLIYAGAASIDVNPDLGETWTDLNDNHYFEGCLDDPTAANADCDEPFEDANGNGFFDATWIGGFGPLRPATYIHDAIQVNAVVLSYDQQYIALVALDVVGLSDVRIHAARDALALDGFTPDQLLVASTHNHQGPDTMGLWGDALTGVSGMDEAYQQRLTATIEAAVRQAAGQMEAVEMTVGAVHMRDQQPKWFNGKTFGGSNPTDKMHGMIRDIRDPVIVSDQLLAMQGVGTSGTVFTWTNWSGHPEVFDSQNGISSDWVGVTRDVLKARYGGVAIHMPEALGGMQSALGGDLPLVNEVDESGAWVFATCTAEDVTNPDDAQCMGLSAGDARLDADGDAVPEWAPRNDWAFVRSHGWHIADAATAALESGTHPTDFPIRSTSETFLIPIDNQAYQLLGPMGIFDLGLDDAILSAERCPEASLTGGLGCIETRTFRAQVGPIGFVGVPGELLPELAWGFPGDNTWSTEQADWTARGDGSTYFPQHDADCNTVAPDECLEEIEVGTCDCLSVHAVPYTLSATGAPPLLEALDTEYVATLGMLDNYLSYIVPGPDFHHGVSLFTDDGDHYEDTVSASRWFGPRVQEAQDRISERW